MKGRIYIFGEICVFEVIKIIFVLMKVEFYMLGEGGLSSGVRGEYSDVFFFFSV